MASSPGDTHEKDGKVNKEHQENQGGSGPSPLKGSDIGGEDSSKEDTAKK